MAVCMRLEFVFMNRGRRWLLVVGCALPAAVLAQALNPALPPGGNFDLANWKLQLPTAGGVLTGTAGSVDEKTPADLEAGFTNAYFFTGADGATVFYAPNNGATTGSSTHPRSELRELIHGSSSDVNWNVFGSNFLAATCVVSNVPSDTGKVCIGQMHEPNTKPDGSPSAGNQLLMIMFDLNNHKIYSNVDYDGESNTSFSTTFISGAGVALNTPITYTITLVNGLMKVSVNNVTNTWNLLGGTNATGLVFTNWDRASSNTVYFKAGCYNQVNNNTLPGGATVAFYSLTRHHAAVITNQPVSVVASNGGNVTFTVGAAGNASVLNYQWRLNGTNVSASATNTSLSLTNINAAQAGSYTVVVSDPTPGFHSVTSAVATLTGNFPPVIGSQPQSRIVTIGSNVTFTVFASGITPNSYRWWFNSTNALTAATNTSFTVTNAQLADAGKYFVVVSNAQGVVTSAVAKLAVGYPPVTSTNVLLDDFWLDGTRTDTALPDESAWFANVGSSLAGVPNALVGTPDPGSTMTWWTYFTSNSSGPVTLAVGDLLRVAARFTVGGSAAANSNRGLRLGLFNSSAGARTLTDGANPNGANHTGYMVNLNFGATIGLSSPLQILERTNFPSANLLSTVADYVVLGQGGPSIGTAAFSNGLPYTLLLTAKRNSGSVDLTIAFSTTNGWNMSYSTTDASATNANFDAFVFRPAAQPQTATNFTFAELKIERVATNNYAPVAGSHAYMTFHDTPFIIAASHLLAGDSDPDADAFHLGAVSGTSTNGGSVALAGGNITYTPVAGFAGMDRFSYTLTDARGAVSTGFVVVTVAPPLRFTAVALTNQALQLHFSGPPDRACVLQATMNLTDAVWQNMATNTADANGAGVFNNLSTANLPQQFFRLFSP